MPKLLLAVLFAVRLVNFELAKLLNTKLKMGGQKQIWKFWDGDGSFLFWFQYSLRNSVKKWLSQSSEYHICKYQLSLNHEGTSEISCHKPSVNKNDNDDGLQIWQSRKEFAIHELLHLHTIVQSTNYLHQFLRAEKHRLVLPFLLNGLLHKVPVTYCIGHEAIR